MDIQPFHKFTWISFLVQLTLGLAHLFFYCVDEGELEADQVVVVHSTLGSCEFNDVVFGYV